MSYELQNWIVFCIVGVVSYLLFGSTLKWVIRRLQNRPEIEENSSYLGLYKEACSRCGISHKS